MNYSRGTAEGGSSYMGSQMWVPGRPGRCPSVSWTPSPSWKRHFLGGEGPGDSAGLVCVSPDLGPWCWGGSLGTEFLGTSPEEHRAALLRPQLCAEELSRCPLQRAGQLAASDGRVGTDE